MLTSAFEWLDRRAAPLLAVALLVGLALPDLAAALRPFLTPAVIGLLASALLRIDWRQVRAYVRRPLLAALMLAWLLVITPVVVWLVMRAVPLPATLVTALMLWSSSPVITAVPAFALLFGLDAAFALIAMLATSLLQPVIQPPLVSALLGIELEIGTAALMGRLALIVGAAVALAGAIGWSLGARRVRHAASPIGGIAVTMLIVFAIGVMDGVTAALSQDPARVLLFIAAAFVVSLALQGAGALAFWRTGRRVALAVALASGNRNMAILIAALGEAAHPDFGLFFACVQFPIYLMPALLGPVYRKLLR